MSWWARASDLFGGRVIPIRGSHVTALALLPDHHRDPFDRMLVAQAIAEGLTLVTGDSQVRAYPVRVVW